jgi:hypothetical protein
MRPRLRANLVPSLLPIAIRSFVDVTRHPLPLSLLCQSLSLAVNLRQVPSYWLGPADHIHAGRLLDVFLYRRWMWLLLFLLRCRLDSSCLFLLSSMFFLEDARVAFFAVLIYHPVFVSFATLWPLVLMSCFPSSRIAALSSSMPFAFDSVVSSIFIAYPKNVISICLGIDSLFFCVLPDRLLYPSYSYLLASSLRSWHSWLNLRSSTPMYYHSISIPPLPVPLLPSPRRVLSCPSTLRHFV